jgi:undecaprenyl diphosphate synthase
MLDPDRLPRHVAIIMDGNGRWAKKRGLPRIFGHKKGVEVVKKIVRKTLSLGIPYLTLYAFSKENWQRPKKEISFLFSLLKEYLAQEVPELKKQDIRLKVIGDKEDFSQDIREFLEWAENETAQGSQLTLCLALSYGGRAEILRAVKLISEEVKKGKLNPSEIEEELFRKFLYTADIPDPDLLIRTSGEMRISNFLIFQMAYTEFYFTPVYWPDFTEEEYIKALEDFQRRERRFGRVDEF